MAKSLRAEPVKFLPVLQNKSFVVITVILFLFNLFRFILQCFDAVGWTAGRAFGL